MLKLYVHVKAYTSPVFLSLFLMAVKMKLVALILARLREGNNHPPLHIIFIKLVCMDFHTSYSYHSSFLYQDAFEKA